MLTYGFPKSLRNDAEFVAKRIAMENEMRVSSEYSSWKLNNVESISFPYRIYFSEINGDTGENFTPVRETIYHCIFSRSCDGHVREKHIAALLEKDVCDWVIPYIVKVCDEYVLEILELVFRKISEADTTAYKEICRLNLKQFVKGHARMISYWNEYYRDIDFRGYIGKKLYEECFGYVISDNKK